MLKLANIASYNAFVALAVDRTTETKAELLLKLRPVKAGRLKALNDMENIEIVHQPTKISVGEDDVDKKQVDSISSILIALKIVIR